MKNIIYLDYHRLKRQNKNLEEFLHTAVSNDKFVRSNVQLIKECLLDWYETEQEIANWNYNENKNSIRSSY